LWSQQQQHQYFDIASTTGNTSTIFFSSLADFSSVTPGQYYTMTPLQTINQGPPKSSEKKVRES